MEDNQILSALFDRNETAMTVLSVKYGHLYRSILWEILENSQDVEECANDTLLAVWNSIPPNMPQNLSAYICKIARRIGIDRLRYQTRKKRGSGYAVTLSELENCLPDTRFSNPEDRMHIRAVLSQFLGELDITTRVLFIRRYVWMESVSSLAIRYNLIENTVSARLSRARKKLKKVLEKEEITL
ncbi:MAG: sigma-70 family RNA polymerase sigma factor [Ruminococcaceae bacterium]|nr:sigma-70 family RNA polymerase sigma factor [Oscillospiraceae bacterium]